jgi:hypothetical protein
MKCEVEGCTREHIMAVSVPNRFTGSRRICQAHWIKIVKANRSGAEELPFRFRERLV